MRANQDNAIGITLQDRRHGIVLTRKLTCKCASLTCITCSTCITCITCITYITYITCMACATFNKCFYRKSKKVWLADSLSDNLKSRDASASKKDILNNTLYYMKYMIYVVPHLCRCFIARGPFPARHCSRAIFGLCPAIISQWKGHEGQ